MKKIDYYILIYRTRDDMQQSLVFTLSNHIAYFVSKFEVLKDSEVLVKKLIFIKNIFYNGLKYQKLILKLKTNYEKG